MAAFGDVFGLGFALEGFSFFVEAIFIAIYVYGWDRIAPRLHFLSGIPVAVAGVTGSFFVIAVNAWMTIPPGSRWSTAGRSTCILGRHCSVTRSSGTNGCTCTSPATSLPAS